MTTLYAIYTTPGLIEDGSWPLTAAGIERGEVERSCWPSDGAEVAVYQSREAAEAAMMSLVPEGSTPGSYAGLSVDLASRSSGLLQYPQWQKVLG